MVFRPRPGAGNFLAGARPQETGRLKYLETATRAFLSFPKRLRRVELYSPTKRRHLVRGVHRLATNPHSERVHLGGVGGLRLLSRDKENAAKELFDRAVDTLRKNLDRYDLGFWSLYELPIPVCRWWRALFITDCTYPTDGSCIGSPATTFFARSADRWEAYARSRAKRTRALCYKGAFKLCYY